MRLRILGPLAVELGSRSDAVGGTIRRRLLAILALERNRTIPADRLVELLWGDDAPVTATNTLQVHVAALRRSLAGAGGEDDLAGDERIRTEAGGYRLVTRSGEVDADEFDRTVADARRWAGLDRARAIALLDQAAALWRGDVLADVALPAELLPTVAGLEAARDAALDLRLRLRLASEDARAVLPELEARVAADPINESWVGLRMVALYRAGRQADALAAFQSARRRLLDDLGLDPSPELRRLELAILRQAAELETDDALGLVPAQAQIEAGSGHPDRLPAELTSFVGRESELAGIAQRLADGARLVTIVGVGGAGKSRLAGRAGRAAETRFADGAAWADLIAATSAEHVAETIAVALGIREELEPPLAAGLPAALRDRELLLVLDNCEHLLAPVGLVVEAVLRAAPRVAVLATSRQPLGLAAEQVLPLDGLALPAADEADPGAIRGSEAVALLLERAHAAAPRRVVSDSDLEAVVAVARRLDGLPLAIEMAAAGLRASSPSELSARLAGPRGSLALSGSTSAARHRTLRATFDSSVEPLGDAERAVFRRLAAFAGPALAASIAAVCGEGIADVPVALSGLVDRSLVVPVPSGRSTRYGLLVPVREYADELLDAAGERTPVLSRHLDWAVELARLEYAHRIPDEAAAIAAINAELDEIRLALARSVGGVAGTEPIPALRPAGQDLAGYVAWFWNVTGRRREGTPICEAALDGAAPAARAHLLRSLGYMATYGGEPERAIPLLRECLEIWQALDVPFERALAHSALGWSYLWPGRNELALSTFERGAEQADRIADPVLRPIMQAILLGDMAQTLVAMRDLPRARELGERVLREASPGDLRTLHFGHHFLGDCALLEGDPATAAVRYARSLELAVALDDPVETCVELEGVAMAQAGLGRAVDALRVFDATEAWLDRMGVEIQVPFWKELKAEWIGPARASLGSAGEPDGAPIGAAAAVALARSLPTTAPEPADGVSGRSSRGP